MENNELKITDLEIGTGIMPSKGALVFAHYEGFLEDGTKFDSSIDRGNHFNLYLAPAGLSKDGIKV